MKLVSFDLDNTIINYDNAARQFSRISGIEESNSICDLKKYLRLLDPTGIKWQQAQAYIYTTGLDFAEFNQDAVATITTLFEIGCKVSIISHKTEYSAYDLKKINLREVSSEWIRESALKKILDVDQDVHFCETREEKVSRIRALRPFLFVDDLQEVLGHQNFPSETLRFWFNQSEEESKISNAIVISNLNQVLKYV